MPLDWQGQWDNPALDVMFKNDVQAMLGVDDGHWRVEKPCVRTFAEQDAFYAKGRTEPGEIVTKAKGGQSPHNYGLAVDVCLIKPDYGVTGKETWTYTDPAWQRLWDLCDAAPRLHSGYHFGDQDHIESTAWKAKKAALISAGQFGGTTP